jgi:short-subunit dehydrogenase
MTDLFSLRGKVALIAGASKEMGAAVARMLAAHGAEVAVAARSAGMLEQLAAEIRGLAGCGKRVLRASAVRVI